MESVFRTKFNEDKFKERYAHDGCMTWNDLARTLVNQVCYRNVDKETQDAIYEAIRDMKFIPGGRYLYYAGRPVKFFNNCFSGDTKILTDCGWLELEDLYENELKDQSKNPKLLSPIDGKYKIAKVHCHGKQKLNLITFVPVRGRSKITYKIKATPNHKWALLNALYTENLQVGDIVPANTFSLAKDDLGFLHGFMFGDGNRHGQLRLCADKDLEYLERLSSVPGVSVTYPEFSDGNPVIYANHKIEWKKVPNSNSTPEYIASFIDGWVAADGSKEHVLCSINKQALEWFREYAPYAGIVISGNLREQIRDVYIGDYYYENHSIFIQNFSRGSSWQGFKVQSIEEWGEEKVFCPYEPEFNRIVINYGIDTYQCYLLRSEEDSREDWANLSWKAESCLGTGGGIGNDYTIYRPKNSSIKRTGGVSSGPVSKMIMINEIGRGVIQGGSRRSAIYASLGWKHGDINEFLTVKNWDDIKVFDKTLADLKATNWNFPAPLDMTNISVNYNTEWLLEYYKTGDVGDVFKRNVLQALQTGDPGFSFNFFDKENETLRNAPVSGETQVLTRNGYKRVVDIVDQLTTVWTGKQWAHTKFKKTKEMTKTVKVQITGGREIICDPDHEFFLQDGSKKPAKLLKNNDELMVSMPTVGVKEHDPESYTLGYMLGDGSFRIQGGGEITLCTPESKSCLQYFDPRAFSFVNQNDSRGFIRCYVKTDWIEYLPKEILPLEYTTPSLIAGLFDSDGSYDKELGMIRLASKHRSFLEGVQRYLESIGILSSITLGGISTYGQKQGYLLVIMRGYVNEFKRQIPTKRFVVENYKPYRVSKLKVISVKEDKLQDVYCCDVNVPEHSFMAEGVIISNCTEVTSEDDSDVCNLGSINLSRVETIEEFSDLVELATIFLLCGTLVADLPYEKVHKVREKNRRLGLGLMGIHEWLLKKGYKYEVVPELHQWLSVYRGVSDATSRRYSTSFNISTPVANRAIAPTGTIGIIAGTTTGIEPVYAVAYKRRYLKAGKWHHQYKIDEAAQILINEGIAPDKVESAIDLATDYERRIKFQADVQDYVDMGISSTINLPAHDKQEFTPKEFGDVLAKYAPRLRGFTAYPDGARGGQPLTSVSYEEARQKLGVEYEDSLEWNDVCDITGGGYCGS